MIKRTTQAWWSGFWAGVGLMIVVLVLILPTDCIPW